MADSVRDNNYITGLIASGSADATVLVRVLANATTGRLLVDSLASIAGNSTIGDGRKTVTTPGTAVALAASTTIKKVHIQALPSNTDAIAVGASTVVASVF